MKYIILSILLPIFFLINTTQPAAEHNIAIPQDLVLYKIIPCIDYLPEEPINEAFRTLQDFALVSRFFYDKLKSTACVNPDLLKKINQFQQFLITDEQTKLLVDWHNATYPHAGSSIHLGTLIFNEKLIENKRDYMEKDRPNSWYWYTNHWFVWPTKKPVEFYVKDNQVITDNPEIKVLYLPERQTLITYAICEYTEKMLESYYEMRIDCGLGDHHVFNLINFFYRKERYHTRYITNILFKKTFT